MSTINTNLFAAPITKAITSANEKIHKASIQTATGERIVEVKDDAAGKSIGEGLKAATNALKVALTNADSAKKVMSIASGGANEISKIVSRLTQIALQSNSGAVADAQRTFLQQEFSSLYAEIDRQGDSTTFNGQKLLDGSLAGNNASTIDTGSTAAKSSASITFAAPAGSPADSTGLLTVNGVAFSFLAAASESVSATDIAIDKTLTAAQKAQKVADIINNKTVSLNSVSTANPHSLMTQANRDKLADLVATVSGSTLTISSLNGGNAGMFRVDIASDANADTYVATVNSGDSVVTVAASTAASMNSSFAAGSTSGSLGVGSVSVFGTMGNASVKTLSQTQSTSGWTTIGDSSLADGKVVTAFGKKFTLRLDVTDSNNEIKVSTTSTLQTLENIAMALNNSKDPALANFYYEVQTSGGNNQIKATSKAASSSFNGMSMKIDSTAVTMASGATAGLDVSGIADNANFVGKISGFSAQMITDNSVKLSVKVGDYIYESAVSNTNPTAADLTVRMMSIDPNNKGGWFDLTIAQNQGKAVGNGSDADAFASSIDSAVKSLTFYQRRDVSSFNPIGTSIEDTKVSMTGKDFTSVSASSVDMFYNQNTQKTTMTVKLADGRTFENSTDLNEAVTKGEMVNLTNKNDSNEKMAISWGRNVDFSDAVRLATVKSEFAKAFGSSKSGMSFQVGLDISQSIDININSLTTASLFNGKSLSVSTIKDAQDAIPLLQAAQNSVIAVQAGIGAVQSRFDFAYQNIITSIENTDAARSLYLDANIPDATKDLSLSQVQQQAAISVLAQMNALSQNLLKLIG